MGELLNVNTVFFTVLDYPMSYVEFVGTVLYLWSVWLVVKRNIITWPVSIVSVALYFVLFYQIHLYADALEQVYYLGANVYGWWYWAKTVETDKTVGDVAFSSTRWILRYASATLVLTAGLTYALTKVDTWMPAIFPEAASYPFLDALTTVMSLTAMWLMARKKIESWVYWIIVDLIGVWLYFAKDVRFISLLYVALTIMAVKGLTDWMNVRVKAVASSEPTPSACTPLTEPATDSPT